MGKHGKKQKHHQKPGRHFEDEGDGDIPDCLPSSAYDAAASTVAAAVEDESEEENEDGGSDKYRRFSVKSPSKFALYQKSVQSPRGDISYLQKFFLLYVGGRLPLHLQEDFCGTALLSTEWLRTDSRRTAVGLDLDLDALLWCHSNNINKIGADGYSRISLFHGNVLLPSKSSFVRYKCEDVIDDLSGMSMNKVLEKAGEEPTDCADSVKDTCKDCIRTIDSLPARDIVCSFNYSCCCLQSRSELITYFKHARSSLSKMGGVFVMDLYGGTSSEGKLKLKRRFSNFTYIWEQEDFDIVNRTTRISLHFQLGKQQMIRHAFTYNWRLWSLPEIKDCLLEAGFRAVHFWLRDMPDTGEVGKSEEYNADQDVKFEEVSSFQQRDAWNAYVVAIAK